MSLEVHLCLLRPKLHTLLSYETMTAVMSHEMAHVICEEHSVEF